MNVHEEGRVELTLERTALAGEYRAATGQPLRRTGIAAALTTVACLRLLAAVRTEGEDPALPTLLLWHARSVVADESLPLLEALLGRNEPVMPFDFLASQPALVGLCLKAHLPGLLNALCLPWTRADGGAIGERSRQLAALNLAEGRCERAIVVGLDRRGSGLQARAVSFRALSQCRQVSVAPVQSPAP